MNVWDQKRRGVRRDTPVVVDAPTDVAVKAVVADTVSESKLITKDRSDLRHVTEAPVTRPRLSQAIGEVEVVKKGNMDEVEKPLEVKMAYEPDSSATTESTRFAARSRIGLVPSSIVENTELVALRTYNRERQAKNRDLVARCAGNLKSQTDTLSKRCAEKKEIVALKLDFKCLTQQLAEASTVREKMAFKIELCTTL